MIGITWYILIARAPDGSQWRADIRAFTDEMAEVERERLLREKPGSIVVKWYREG